MGTVNYKTSDIITIGLRPYEPRDFELDPDFMNEARRQSEEYGIDIETITYDTIAAYQEDDQINAQAIIDNYDLEYFTVTIEPGYYEGFSIDITDNLPSEFYNDAERIDALTDAENLGDMLKRLVCDACLVEVWPGWCTTYKDQGQSITAVRKAIKGLIYDINDIPKYEQEEQTA